MNFISDFLRSSKRQSNRGRCLHYENGIRCNEIISAHSIQNRGQLNIIAEDGHVYRFNADISNLKKTNGRPFPQRIGVNRASTFLGFCKVHDNELFEPIDNAPLQPNWQQIALYAYRCICREIFVKENAVMVAGEMKSHSALSMEKQAILYASQLGHRMALEGLQHHKSIYDKSLSAKNYEQFEFVVFSSLDPCNVQLSGLLYPDFDFEGNLLQDLARFDYYLDLITFFTAPTTKGWAFCFAWHVSSNNTCLPLIQSLASKIYHGEKPADALLRFSLSCCENHAIKISWWDALSESAKIEAVERMRLMADPYTPVPSNYLVSGCEGIANWGFEYVESSLEKYQSP